VARSLSPTAENNRVRRVLNGTTVAGNGDPGFDGDHGPATKAAIGSPAAVAVNSAGTLFIAANGRVRRVADGVISTIAGTGVIGSSGDNGPAINAAMDPRALAVDAEGFLYIADEAGQRVRRVYKGVVTTVAAGTRSGPGGRCARRSFLPMRATIGFAVFRTAN
jgi:hypothetical protein